MNSRPTGSLISYFSNLVKNQGGINLAQGIPDFAPPKELLSILRQSIDKPFHQYAPGIGDFKLLEIIAKRYLEYSPLESDNILIVQGATEGISLVFLYLTSILKKNGVALSFDPPYESYPKLAGIYGVHFEYFDYNQDLSVDFDKLEAAIKNTNVKIVLIASPGNPLAKIWTQEEMEKITRLSEKYDFYIIYDAVYKDIYFDTEPFNPIQLKNDRLFYIDSFSKTLSITGWRVGYVITVKKHIQNLRGIHDYTGLCAPTIFQKVIAQYIEENRFGEDYVSAIKQKCKQSSTYLKDRLLTFGFKVPDSLGGYFLWAELPASYKNGLEFAEKLYARSKVAVVPGENFSPNKLNYIRFNFATEMETIKQAAERIGNFLNQKINKDRI